MKIFTPFVFCFFFSSLTFSQNAWDLFPEGQKTWWRIPGDSLKLFYNDSSETVASGKRMHLFGQKYVAGVFGEACFWDLYLESLSDPIGIFPMNPPREYFYPMYSKDGVWDFNDPAQPVIFRSDYLPGQSWSFPVNAANAQFTSVNISCIAADTITVFGSPTAARYYKVELPSNPDHPLNGFVFTLTEKFGFTRFVSLFDLKDGQNSPVYEMAGFEKNAAPKGVAPSFDSFFGHYQVGDLYKWKCLSYDYMSKILVTSWYLDSIQNVYYLPEKVILKTLRKNFQIKTTDPNPNGQMIMDTSQFNQPYLSVEYPRINYGPMLDATPYWYSPSYAYGPGGLLDSRAKFNSEGFLEIYAILTRGFFSAADCKLIGLADLYQTATVHQQFGLIRETTESGYGFSDCQLIGNRQNGVVWGDISEPATVSVFSTPDAGNLTLYPNPTSGALKLNLPENLGAEAFFDLEVTDILGKICFKMAHFQGEKLDLSALKSGMYFLTLSGNGKLWRTAFVRE